MLRRSSQIDLPLREKKSWGGLREGAGRKKKKGAVVSRKARPALNGSKHSVHVTMRAVPGIPSLRMLHFWIRRALLAASQKADFRVVYFSIPGNHLHLIVEAADKRSLSRGMQGLAVRIAHSVNQALSRKRGKVFSDRYHAHVLKTPSETKRALAYLIHNYKQHMQEGGRPVRDDFIDPCSSAIYLAGLEKNPFPRPRTWYLDVGWRKAGGAPIKIGRAVL